MHFDDKSLQLPICLCFISQHLMHIKLGPASQYFSTTLISFSNRKLDAQSFLTSASLLMGITIADP